VNRDNGTVTRITPSFVEVTVKATRIAPGFTSPGHGVEIGDELLLKFDRNGQGEDGQFTPGGYGVWHIDNMPFAERTACFTRQSGSGGSRQENGRLISR
jgi:hypothetical protein